MANKYETMLIYKSSLGKDRITELNDKIQSCITENEGKVESLKEIGSKEFATEFKKQTKGYYVVVNFEANAKTLDELNRQISVTEDIFRYLTVTKDSVEMKNLKAVKEAVSRK